MPMRTFSAEAKLAQYPRNPRLVPTHLMGSKASMLGLSVRIPARFDFGGAKDPWSMKYLSDDRKVVMSEF